jgi:DNA-binding MarR family transcriptional regulator
LFRITIDGVEYYHYVQEMIPTEFLAFLRPTLHLSVCSTRQLAILALLAEAQKPIDFGAGALNLQISKPAMTRNLDTLQEDHLFVERLYSKAVRGPDRRRVFLGITDKGTEFLERMGIVA